MSRYSLLYTTILLALAPHYSGNVCPSLCSLPAATASEKSFCRASWAPKTRWGPFRDGGHVASRHHFDELRSPNHCSLINEFVLKSEEREWTINQQFWDNSPF